MIICGPNVFREQKKYFDQSKFWFAVVSRSLQKRPKGCDILSSEPNACYNSTAYEHIAGHDRMMSMPSLDIPTEYLHKPRYNNTLLRRNQTPPSIFAAFNARY